MVCKSPCDEDLEAAGEYRVVGTSITPSSALELKAKTSPVVLEVSPNSPAGTIAGGTLIVVGGIGAIASTVALVTALTLPDNSSRDVPVDGKGVLTVIGIGALAVSASLITAGIAAVYASGTDLTKSTPKRKDAFVRQPTWIGHTAAAASRTSFTVPLAFSF
ncbi:MAG: hypothetical protein ABIP89_24575 [Polyangiaceae bacterium]